jgi:hypothetical protein
MESGFDENRMAEETEEDGKQDGQKERQSQVENL